MRGGGEAIEGNSRRGGYGGGVGVGEGGRLLPMAVAPDGRCERSLAYVDGKVVIER
jgi:hypothetical protein